MTVEAVPFETYVPHRGLMCIVGRLIRSDATSAVSETEVPFDGLFVRDGGVPAWIGIEYMAQTISAWAGAGMVASGEKPKLGFLLGCRSYIAHRPTFPSGSLLRTEIRSEYVSENGMGLFECRILVGECLLAEGRLTVLQPDDGAAIPSGDAE